MADIAKQAALSAEAGVLQGASQLFGFLWSSAWKHGHATAAGDAEALHDMRVDLRRLRTAMQNFEGPKTAPLLSAPLRRELRARNAGVARLGEALGRVRDFDVLSEYVSHYARKKLETNVESVEGLDKFVHYLQLQRARAFTPMVKRIGRAQETGELREKFARWALGLPAADGAPISLQTAAHLILPRRLDEVKAHAKALQPGAHPEAHHDLRKALRRVRYTLETLSVCFEGDAKIEVKTAVKQLVEMQDLLGEMQDREVIAHSCAQCFGKSEPDAIVAFNAHGAKRLSYLLGRVRAKWDEAQTNGLWTQLEEL